MRTQICINNVRDITARWRMHCRRLVPPARRVRAVGEYGAAVHRADLRRTAVGSEKPVKCGDSAPASKDKTITLPDGQHPDPAMGDDLHVRLAVVEDDDEVGDALVEVLTDHGFVAERKTRGADILLGHRQFDAVILDLGLPDGDGLHVLRQLREVSTVPVVILTARDDERTVVRGLRNGADDYIVKPPRIPELVARLEAVTRRASTAIGQESAVIVTDDVRVDLAAREVEVGGELVVLTQKEFDLVETLVERPGSAVSREALMDKVWGDAFMAVSRSLDVHISTLRQKLGKPGLITTIRGYGYRWGK